MIKYNVVTALSVLLLSCVSYLHGTDVYRTEDSLGETRVVFSYSDKQFQGYPDWYPGLIVSRDVHPIPLSMSEAILISRQTIGAIGAIINVGMGDGEWVISRVALVANREPVQEASAQWLWVCTYTWSVKSGHGTGPLSRIRIPVSFNNTSPHVEYASQQAKAWTEIKLDPPAHGVSLPIPNSDQPPPK